LDSKVEATTLLQNRPFTEWDDMVTTSLGPRHPTNPQCALVTQGEGESGDPCLVFVFRWAV